MKEKIYLNWSSGKDASMALHLLNQGNHAPELLVTTISKNHERVSMHGLRKSLLTKQLEALNIPFKLVPLAEDLSHESYNKLMDELLSELKGKGFKKAAFGDIFLEDLKAYREKQLLKKGFSGLFPLWKKNTRELAAYFQSNGFRAIVVCVNGDKLDKSFVGRYYDQAFLDDLPENVDPCGENGEFHTFCFSGPIFKQPVDFELGEIQTEFYKNPDGSTQDIPFYFQDLLPAE